MMFLFLYTLSVLFVSTIFLLLNNKVKWVTQRTLQHNNSDFYIISLLFGAIFWPIALIIVAIVLFVTFILENFFSKD